MTSATFSRTRTMSGRRMRAAAVAASLAGALALTACSGDGGSGANDDSAGPSASGTSGADTGGGTGGTGGSGSAAGDLEGSWLATTEGGKAVVLMVNGKEAGLFATGGTVCSGSVGKEEGGQVIRLKCTDGSKDRSIGTVGSVGKTSMTVRWSGLGAEAYTKAEGGKMPTGLPTAVPGA